MTSSRRNERLTVDALMSMTPIVNGQDVVRLAARHVLLGQLKNQPTVRDVFFAGSTSADVSSMSSSFAPLTSEYEAVAMTSWFDFSRYSVLLAAQAICKLKDEYQIHAMLDEQLVSEQLQAIHDSSDWKKIGFALYTSLFCDLVKDEATRAAFRDFKDEATRAAFRDFVDKDEATRAAFRDYVDKDEATRAAFRDFVDKDEATRAAFRDYVDKDEATRAAFRDYVDKDEASRAAFRDFVDKDKATRAAFRDYVDKDETTRAAFRDYVDKDEASRAAFRDFVDKDKATRAAFRDFKDEATRAAFRDFVDKDEATRAAFTDFVDKDEATRAAFRDFKDEDEATRAALRDFVDKDEATRAAFRDFVDKDPRKWAQRMCERVRDMSYVEAWLVKPLSTGLITQERINCEVNIFFVKLHLLDPTAVLPAFHCLNKVIPTLSLQLTTTNYIGGPLEWTLIRNEVESAVQRPSFATNVANPALCTGPLEYYCGVRVTEFIMLECRELGLWSGSYPDNGRVSQLRDRCRIM